MSVLGIWLAMASALLFIGGLAAAILGVFVPMEWGLFYFIGLPLGLVIILAGEVAEWANRR